VARAPKPYIKCEKRNGAFHLTLMKSTGRNLVLAGRDSVPVDDWFALQQTVIALIEAARLADRNLGVQVDGDS